MSHKIYRIVKIKEKKASKILAVSLIALLYNSKNAVCESLWKFESIFREFLSKNNWNMKNKLAIFDLSKQ